MSYITTIKIALAAMRGEGKNVRVNEKQLAVESGETFPIDIYEPHNPQKCLGTILFVHGMNHFGNKDPRIMIMCRAMALNNYRVIVPHYSVIANCNVDLCSIGEIEETIKAIVADKTLSQGKQIGVFAVSFSGFFSLCAAKNPKIAPLISSLCCLGIAYQSKSTFTNILAEKSDDYYAKFISIKNFYRIEGKLTPVLEQGFTALIADAHVVDLAQPNFNAFIATLPDGAEKQLLLSILNSAKEKRDLSLDYEKQIERMHEIFSVGSDPQGVSCFVTLIHSANDKVLHAIESKLLYAELIKYKIPARILITPLLDHADFHFSFKYIVEMVKFIRTFDGFFKKIK